METAATQTQPQHHAAKRPLNEQSEKIARRLWQRMLELYGRQWEASYGHVDGEVFPAWRDALTELNPNQIKSGLDAVIKEGHDYPPNLIKFMRLCRSGPPPAYKTYKSIARPTPRYSVMRIERAKQLALTGDSFKPPEVSKRMLMDWSDSDEAELTKLIATWHRSTGLKGLNAIIDKHEFSHGSQRANTSRSK